ncbi:hypothetical protein Gotur_035523 [Gossypium turneri]
MGNVGDISIFPTRNLSNPKVFIQR